MSSLVSVSLAFLSLFSCRTTASGLSDTTAPSSTRPPRSFFTRSSSASLMKRVLPMEGGFALARLGNTCARRWRRRFRVASFGEGAGAASNGLMFPPKARVLPQLRASRDARACVHRRQRSLILCWRERDRGLGTEQALLSPTLRLGRGLPLGRTGAPSRFCRESWWQGTQSATCRPGHRCSAERGRFFFSCCCWKVPPLFTLGATRTLWAITGAVLPLPHYEEW